MKKFQIVLTTAKPQNGKEIAKNLIESKLAACVQIMPVQSYYEWENKICEDNEILLLIKSRKALFKEIEIFIKSLHEYEIPEIIAIPIENGFVPYLNWLKQNTKAPE